MSRDDHPSDEVLEAFGQGRLEFAVAARLEAHIAICAICGEKLSHIAEDSLSRLIRASSSMSEDPSREPIAIEDAPALDIPPELRGHNRYRIEKRLGGGGMGVVYKATHRMMHRTVALKVIRPDLLATPAAVTRFRREAQAAAQLSHPNIVTAFDADETSGVSLLVMEYVDGITLEDWVERNGSMSWRLACGVIRQAALGLEHAHRRGMIHRDIKPANLMIEASGNVKILDFGLAAWSSREDAAITRAGAHIGTPAFAAPEQFPASDRIDARADEYGLGATFAYLLTAHTPTGSPVALPADVPAPVQTIVQRMLAKRPDERFPSLEAVADALDRWCDDGGSKPVTASRARWIHRAIFAACITLAVLLPLLAMAIWNRSTPQLGVESDALPILFLLPSKGLWHEDYQPFRDTLEAAGRKVIVATPGGHPSMPHPMSFLGRAKRPAPIPADLDLVNVEPHHFDALVCVGADHSEFTDEDSPFWETTNRLLRLADQAEKKLAAVCAGQHVLGAAGILRGRKVARPSEYFDDPAAMGAVPQASGVVADGRIFTGSTSNDSAATATLLLKHLQPTK